MAELETVTAPLVVRFAAGDEKVVARAFPHPLGIVYLDLFWHLSRPDDAAHLIRGELRGNGPWRVGDASIRVLGCGTTDPLLQAEYIPWRDYLNEHPGEYPPEAQILTIARRLGCIIPGRSE
ncbi:hypothetical protein [Thiolapillus sp.]|uniref:hypothetical protein n=1 Tax=Thiolapillus sp. TaxID=2017437 RepID=UPI0025F03968|nr:hypothetical protein [Thiolapillus sp.]